MTDEQKPVTVESILEARREIEKLRDDHIANLRTSLAGIPIVVNPGLPPNGIVITVGEKLYEQLTGMESPFKVKPMHNRFLW